MGKYGLGLVSVSFRKNTPDEILKAVSDSALSFIEWGSDIHAPCRDREALLKIAKMQSEYGIKCSSYGTYFRLGQTPISELYDYIEAAQILGTDILRVWCGVRCGAEYNSDERAELIEQCRIAARMASDAGVTICTECHAGTFTERLSDAVYLFNEVGSKSFCSYWQPFQTKSIEENLLYAETIAPFARHLHVFQWKGSERFSLNEGIDEWRAYLSKFDTPRMLLLEFMPDDDIATLKGEACALRRIIAGKA